MRVVVSCDWFLKYAASQAAGLARAGADVLLLCREHTLEFGGDGEERARVLQVAQEAGVRTAEMPGRYWDVSSVPRLAALRRRIVRFGPDIIHAHEGSDPRALALVPRVPIVVTIHDPKPHPGQSVAAFGPKRWLLKQTYDAWVERASVAIVHSERVRDELELLSGQQYFVVHHGLDVSDEPLQPPPEPTVGFFGRLEPYKGLDVLARSMRRVWAHRPEIRLKVTGSGSSAFPLEDHRVDIERRYLPEAEVESFFAATSLAVLPYTEASQSGVGSQAVGHGVPVVATRLGGLPDLALDETYLVDPGDDAALADAILRHIDDDGYTRARVLAQVAAPRSWDAAAARSIQIYEDTVGKRSRGVHPSSTASRKQRHASTTPPKPVWTEVSRGGLLDSEGQP